MQQPTLIFPHHMDPPTRRAVDAMDRIMADAWRSLLEKLPPPPPGYRWEYVTSEPQAIGDDYVVTVTARPRKVLHFPGFESPEG